MVNQHHPQITQITQILKLKTKEEEDRVASPEIALHAADVIGEVRPTRTLALSLYPSRALDSICVICEICGFHMKRL